MPVMPMARRPRLAGPINQHHVDAAPAEPGLYRTRHRRRVARRSGLVAGAQLAGAEDVLRRLSDHPGLGDPASSVAARRNIGVTTFQAEDEIAAIGSRDRRLLCRVSLGVTSSSGPGIALKGEAMGLAIMTELPLGHRQFCSAAVRRPGCRPRPSSPISIRPSMAATAMRRCR